MAGTPEEEVGYIASDEYTHRLSSPPPESRRDSRPAFESPLRKSSLPAAESQAQQDEAVEKAAFEKPQEPRVIHVDEPYHHLHHPDGFAQTPDPEELNRGFTDGNEDDEPILAADEVRPESAYQHPAVSPSFERSGSVDYEGRSHTPSATHSRSNSRAASVQSGMPALTRYDSREEHGGVYTPLEDVEEYEPLFPEDDAKDKKTVSTAERFKQRPELKHRFPSQDIWEDSPNSLQLHATVSTPEGPKQEAFETPEQESFRRSHASHLDPHQVATQILESEEHDEKPPARPEVAKQRFPSRDIWEDAPESHTLVTTIEPSEEEVKSPEVPSKPSIPLRPQKRPQQAPAVDASTKPVTSPIEKRQPPVIPDRPKPQIPARPAKPISRASPEESKDIAPKPKPAVPARPGGSKIAALKAGFLSDLNSRLQLGPQAPPKPQEKKKEEEAAPVEKQPLSDARKGRARGPARRKPAVEKASTRLPTIPEVRITTTLNVWQVGEDGNLVVGSEANSAVPDTKPDTMAPAIAKNIAGESVDPQPLPEKEEEVSASPKDTTVTESKEPTFTEAAHSISTDSAAEPSPAVEPVVKEDVPIAKETSSPEQEVDNVAETLAASADGKRPSEGDIGETQ